MLLALGLALPGCRQRSATGAIVVSAIGGAPRFVDPGRAPLDPASQALMGATAQGLVRFDAAGQIEPGLAERWIVIDDGTSYIFRLRDARWSDGKPVTAEQIATVLRRQIGEQSRNPLAQYLTAIDQIVAMTPQVIEIHLARGRPDLLRLLAQPALGVFRARPPGGTGPFMIDRWISRDEALLRPGYDPDLDEDDDAAKPGRADMLDLIGERAAPAIERFTARQSDLVAGGSFTDWPLVADAHVAQTDVRRDPATGLFGLAIVERGGFLADPANRAAVAESIDRDSMTAAIAPDWPALTQLLPAQLDSAAAPASPAWASMPLDARRRDARARFAAWRATNPGPLTLRIALPGGPGANLLYGYVGAALISIGIVPQRVAIDADADLRLIDAVSPVDTARWYLATACGSCSDDAKAAIEAARLATDVRDRATGIAVADAALTKDAAFIPLAQPLRWSLVAPGLDQWQANAHVSHPLNHLRSRPN